jgi:hypothetical protein
MIVFRKPEITGQRRSNGTMFIKKERVYYYEFDSPAQLLMDFWATVDEYTRR